MQKVPWSIELDEPMKLKDELIKKGVKVSCMELGLTQAPVKDRQDCNLVGNEIKIQLTTK